jgi:hypothetical protein
LSTKTDHPDGPSTLPVPELNPLLNPVLGQHMGRWAEVYFTSPPEKREQAVLELLQELQGEAATAEGITSPPPPAAPEELPEPLFRPVSEIPVVLAPRIRCHACGRENPASHRFCGMCGTQVAAPAEGDLPAENPHQSEPASSKDNQPRFVSSDEAVYEPAITTNELSLFQGGREGLHHGDQDDNEGEIFSYSQAPRSYRAYVGIALTIIICALAYMAWRSGQSTIRTWNRKLPRRLRSLPPLRRPRRARPHLRPHPRSNQRPTPQSELRPPTGRQTLRQTQVAPRSSQR